MFRLKYSIIWFLCFKILQINVAKNAALWSLEVCSSYTCSVYWIIKIILEYITITRSKYFYWIRNYIIKMFPHIEINCVKMYDIWIATWSPNIGNTDISWGPSGNYKTRDSGGDGISDCTSLRTFGSLFRLPLLAKKGSRCNSALPNTMCIRNSLHYWNKGKPNTIINPTYNT